MAAWRALSWLESTLADEVIFTGGGFSSQDASFALSETSLHSRQFLALFSLVEVCASSLPVYLERISFPSVFPHSLVAVVVLVWNLPALLFPCLMKSNT